MQSTRSSQGSKQKRIALDILFFALDESCGPGTSDAFMRDMMPKLKFSQEAFRELTEAEYQFTIQQVREELPYFMRWVLDREF